MPVTLPEWIEGVVFIEEDGAKRILPRPQRPWTSLDIPGPRIEGIEHDIAWLRNRQSREVGKLAARRPEGLQFSRFRMIQICADYLLEKCVLQFKGFKCFKVWVQSFFESKSEVPIETDHFL